jgi:SAM-dependent methyltransferase
MKVDQILTTYDENYSIEHDQTFLFSEWARPSWDFQYDVLKKYVSQSRTWLDVACGTGYILSQFNGIEKAGLDISPAMIHHARKRNPETEIIIGNFLDDFPEFEGKWDLVTCMWWAYCLVESISDIRRLIANLAKWTSENGTCFIPLCNPQKFDTQNIKLPYIDPKVPGRIMITGITWTYIDENGKRHDDVVSPQVEHMVVMFREFFHEVEIVEGPLDQIGEGWRVQDILIARKKKNKNTIDHVLNFPLDILQDEHKKDEKAKPEKANSMVTKFISKILHLKYS